MCKYTRNLISVHSFTYHNPYDDASKNYKLIISVNKLVQHLYCQYVPAIILKATNSIAYFLQDVK